MLSNQVSIELITEGYWEVTNFLCDLYLSISKTIILDHTIFILTMDDSDFKVSGNLVFVLFIGCFEIKALNVFTLSVCLPICIPI